MNAEKPRRARSNPAAKKRFRRELAEFERAFAALMRDLKAGKSLLAILNVVPDPCDPKSGKHVAYLIKTPPDPNVQPTVWINK